MGMFLDLTLKNFEYRSAWVFYTAQTNFYQIIFFDYLIIKDFGFEPHAFLTEFDFFKNNATHLHSLQLNIAQANKQNILHKSIAHNRFKSRFPGRIYRFDLCRDNLLL